MRRLRAVASEYIDDRLLKLEKERNRLLERLIDKLGDIQSELVKTRRALPLDRMIIPVLRNGDSDDASMSAVWGVRKVDKSDKEENENG
jgi:hypothetical protein